MVRVLKVPKKNHLRPFSLPSIENETLEVVEFRLLIIPALGCHKFAILPGKIKDERSAAIGGGEDLVSNRHRGQDGHPAKGAFTGVVQITPPLAGRRGATNSKKMKALIMGC